MNVPYEPPKIDSTAFNCPFCHAYSDFYWSDIHAWISGSYLEISQKKIARCRRCEKWSLWVNEIIQSENFQYIDNWRMVYPEQLSAPMPSSDMPEICKGDYLEARQILPYSPRGAAALLRLCIQKLCVKFGEKGKKLDDDIASLVKKGLDERIQKALDIVRVTGNNSVHPGEMNIEDNPEIADKLFKFINMIVEEMITKPKELDELYGTLPEGAQEAIEKRDSGSSPE